MKKNIGILITDGVGYRNFILSEFPKVVLNKFDKAIIFSCLPVSAYPDKVKQLFEIIELEVFREGMLTGFLRKIKELAHLRNHSNNNYGIYDNYLSNINKRLTKKGILSRLALLLAEYFHDENWILHWTKLQMRSIRNHHITQSYLKLLKQYNPDILFFTHQRPPFVAPMIEAACQASIPTAAFIFSWDNLASKGRMAGNFNHYLVWSELMKTELLQFYPSVTDEQIHVVGTPQFEPYVMEKYKTDKNDFFSRFQVEPNKPMLCFSCGDISTSKNDELYIETIAEAIIDHSIDAEVNLIVRTSPAEAPNRFFAMAEKYPFIKWNYPDWIYVRDGHPEPWTQRIPTEQDVKDLRALLEYCDVNINMCSTMSLDFMQFNKPVINPVFGNGTNGLYDDQRFLKYAHYKRVAESGAVTIVKHKEALITAINNALLHPHQSSEQRGQLIDMYIGRELKECSQSFIETLSSCLDK